MRSPQKLIAWRPGSSSTPNVGVYDIKKHKESTESAEIMLTRAHRNPRRRGPELGRDAGSTLRGQAGGLRNAEVIIGGHLEPYSARDPR